MAEADQPDSIHVFAEIARMRVEDSDMATVLTRVAEFACASVPGAAEVSVTLVQNGRPVTAAHTGPLSVNLDERQYSSGFGPCLAAAAALQIFTIPDTAVDERWLDFSSLASAKGIGSVVSIGFVVQEGLSAALNVYGTTAGAFGSSDVETLKSYSGYAGVVLANQHVYEATATLAGQLKTAMESRAVIEQAKGILIGQRGVDADEAFAILSRASQTTNRKLHAVARDLVASCSLSPRRSVRDSTP